LFSLLSFKDAISTNDAVSMTVAQARVADTGSLFDRDSLEIEFDTTFSAGQRNAIANTRSPSRYSRVFFFFFASRFQPCHPTTIDPL
jgi:hypothetical protein